MLSAKSVTASRDFDQFCVLKGSVQDRGGRRNITDQLAQVFNRTIARHHGAAKPLASHDDLEEEPTALFGKLLRRHIVKDQKVQCQVTLRDPVVTFQCFAMQDISNAVEDVLGNSEEAFTDQRQPDAIDEGARTFFEIMQSRS